MIAKIRRQTEGSIEHYEKKSSNLRERPSKAKNAVMSIFIATSLLMNPVHVSAQSSGQNTDKTWEQIEHAFEEQARKSPHTDKISFNGKAAEDNENKELPHGGLIYGKCYYQAYLASLDDNFAIFSSAIDMSNWKNVVPASGGILYAKFSKKVEKGEEVKIEIKIEDGKVSVTGVGLKSGADAKLGYDVCSTPTS